MLSRLGLVEARARRNETARAKTLHCSQYTAATSHAARERERHSESRNGRRRRISPRHCNCSPQSHRAEGRGHRSSARTRKEELPLLERTKCNAASAYRRRAEKAPRGLASRWAWPALSVKPRPSGAPIGRCVSAGLLPVARAHGGGASRAGSRAHFFARLGEKEQRSACGAGDSCHGKIECRRAAEAPSLQINRSRIVKRQSSPVLRRGCTNSRVAARQLYRSAALVLSLSHTRPSGPCTCTQVLLLLRFFSSPPSLHFLPPSLSRPVLHLRCVVPVGDSIRTLAIGQRRIHCAALPRQVHMTGSVLRSNCSEVLCRRCCCYYC